MPPPGSRGGKDDIAAPVQSSEESLKNMIEAENKKGIAKIKQRQKMLDDAIDNVSPSLTGDRKYDAEIVAADLAERMGLVYDDLPTKQRLDLYDKAYTGLSKRRQMQRESLEDFVDDAGGVDPDDPRGIDDFIPDPEDMAKGGIARIGLKDGMNRRTFLKILGGAMSIPIIGKILKPLKIGKTVTKVPIIKTDNVAGKPEWFDQLVNKVILEGDDVTKRFATKDREVVHMKKLDDDTNVMVTQDLDEGAVRVEYNSTDNVYEDPVSLRYKKPNPDEGDPRPSAEFDVAESGPVGRADGPDDYSIDIDEVGGTSISDLTSDVSKLKEYATGKKPTLKEFVQSKKRKDKARKITEGGEGEMDAVIERQGEFIENDLVDLDPGDFASGGIARLKYQMGGDVAFDAADKSVYGSSAITVTPDTVMDQFGNQVQAQMGNNFNKPLIPQVTEQASKQEGIMNSSPVVSQLDGTGQVDMPVAGGINNANDILPVESQDSFTTDARYRDPGPGIGTGDKLEAVQYKDPLPKDQLLSGFEQFKKDNPEVMRGAGTSAMVPVTLPGGYSYDFSGSLEANAFRKYLESIGQAPYQRRQDPEMFKKFASGGIARMLGE